MKPTSMQGKLPQHTLWCRVLSCGCYWRHARKPTKLEAIRAATKADNNLQTVLKYIQPGWLNYADKDPVAVRQFFPFQEWAVWAQRYTDKRKSYVDSRCFESRYFKQYKMDFKVWQSVESGPIHLCGGQASPLKSNKRYNPVWHALRWSRHS